MREKIGRRNEREEGRMVAIRTQSPYLPQHHAIGPHIGSTCELSVDYGLNGHPLQRDTSFGTLHIHLLCLPGHAKVSDFQCLALTDENISAGQVTMHNAKAGKILLL